MIELTKSQIDILGRPNFTCSAIANLLIESGVYKRGPKKAEYEQAVCIHWLSGILNEHGESWRVEARRIVKDLTAKVRQGGAI